MSYSVILFWYWINSVMKFATGKDTLEKAISRIDAIVPGRDTQTLLSNLLIASSDEEVRITASDMESTVQIKIDARDVVPGELIVPAKKLSEISKQLRADQVHLSATENTEAESSEDGNYIIHLHGDSSRSARFRLSGSHRSHFPDIGSVPTESLVSIPAPMLAEMIRKTIYAISQEDNRYIYNGLCFLARENKLTLVGTDGRRLAAITRTLPGPLNFSNDESADVVVHAKAIRELQRIIDSSPDISLGTRQRDIFFEVGDATLSSRLLEGKFPDFNKVVPSETGLEFELDRSVLLDAISQVKVMTEQPSFQVKMSVEAGNLILEANTPDVGTADIQIPIGLQSDPLTIAFNANYLIEILRNLDCHTVKVGLNDANKPILIRDIDDPDFLALVMPMRL
jgi:DNA polymerase III subunit beta